MIILSFNTSCNNREKVDLEISDMITPKLTDMTRMFNKFGVDSKVVKIKFDSINTSNVTTADYMFFSLGDGSESIKIYGLNDLDLSKVETMRFFLSNVPELSIGTLDIYADDIYCILNNSQVKGILNIHNKPTSFDSALDIKPEGEITVNYSSEVDNIDQIIATASGNPKVIKGNLIN